MSRVKTTAPLALAMMLVMTACASLAGIGEGTDDALATEPKASLTQTDENIEITPATLDFADVPCGTQPMARPIRITNNGKAEAAYSVTPLPAGSPFIVEGALEGKVAANRTVTLNVSVKPQMARDNSADLYISAGKAKQPVHVVANGTGAALELEQSALDFGEVRKETPGEPIPLSIKNTGTLPANVTFTSSLAAVYDVTWTERPKALSIPPGEKGTFTVQLLPATTVDMAALKASVTATSTGMCGAPAMLALTGRRVTSEVTVSAADFGRQDCNTAPAPRNVVVTNYSSKALGYTAALAAGAASPFTITDPGPGTVAATPTGTMPPKSEVIKVAPKALGATLADLKDQLVVTLSGGITGTRTAQLHVEIRGPIVTITPTEIKDFASDGNTTDTRQFTVKNDGNEDITLSWNLQSNGGFSANSPQSIYAGFGPRTGTISFKPSTAGTFDGKLTPSPLKSLLFSSRASCNPLPVINLQGKR